MASLEKVDGEIVEDNSIKADCKVTGEYLDRYNQKNELLFKKMLHELLFN